MRLREEVDTETNMKRVLKKQAKKKRSGTPGELLLVTKTEASLWKATVRIVCQREFHTGQGTESKRAAEAL